MKVLVVGSGGREHALCWKISKSPLVKKVFTAPGNGGTSSCPKNSNVPIKATDTTALLDFAGKEKIDLTVVGPEDPLSSGIADTFRSKGLKIFGPSSKASELESSKCFAKDFLKKNSIPTPDFKVIGSYEEGLKEIERFEPPIVLKADGLAMGKGVKIANSKSDAAKELKSMMVDLSLGQAGKRVIIDEFIKGTEISYIALCDGETFLPLATSQDNKRLLDNDVGPNTGGMGAYSPIPLIDSAMEESIKSEIIKKTMDGMKNSGRPYSGALYAGLIYKGRSPLVLEYNVRFGDPETQPLLFRMKSDIVPLLLACAEGNLKGKKIEWEDKSSICIVMTSEGYPGQYKKGLPIEGPLDINSTDEDAIVFHAGTRLEKNVCYTNGGRVLGVCAKDKNFKKAKEKAMELARSIKFEGAHFRKDIGDKIL